MRIPRRLIGSLGSLLAHEGLIGRPPRRAPRAPPGGEPPFTPLSGPPRAPGGPRKPPGNHQGPYGPIQVHTNPYGHLPGQFSRNMLAFLFFWKLIWEGSVGIHMDRYGPVWVRMVPEDSLGASWGLLGPWGPRKGSKGGFTPLGGPGGPPGRPAY